jgi:hypothetical protein
MVQWYPVLSHTNIPLDTSAHTYKLILGSAGHFLSTQSHTLVTEARYFTVQYMHTATILAVQCMYPTLHLPQESKQSNRGNSHHQYKERNKELHSHPYYTLFTTQPTTQRNDMCLFLQLLDIQQPISPIPIPLLPSPLPSSLLSLPFPRPAGPLYSTTHASSSALHALTHTRVLHMTISSQRSNWMTEAATDIK